MTSENKDEVRRQSTLPDRAWFSFGLTAKMGDPGDPDTRNYCRIDAGYARDLKPGETFQKAVDDISRDVVAEILSSLDGLGVKL